MIEGESLTYRNRIIYRNMYEEYCVCHMTGGMVAYNAGFDSIPKAMLYIDKIVSRGDLLKRDFEEIAKEVKSGYVIK